ncbi:MAG: hypothetical protein ACQGVK_22100 [Myxococcota bacterium]
MRRADSNGFLRRAVGAARRRHPTVRFAIAGLGLLVLAQPAAAQTRVSAGLDYWSDYFWRGFSFYGDESSPRGVLFPWVAASWKQLSFSVVGEVPESMFGGKPNSTEKAWVGVDFILSGEASLLDDRLAVGGRTAYFLYPNSRHENDDDGRNDFAELAAWIQLPKLPLRPRLEYSQYFRVDDRGGEQDVYEDIYLRFSLEHGFEPLEHLLVSTRGSIAYFWYPSSKYWNDPDEGGHGDDYRGLSDIVASIGLSTDYWRGFTPKLGLNVAYVPDRDFYRVWGRDQRWHAWVTAGVSYAWSLDGP